MNQSASTLCINKIRINLNKRISELAHIYQFWRNAKCLFGFLFLFRIYLFALRLNEIHIFLGFHELDDFKLLETEIDGLHILRIVETLGILVVQLWGEHGVYLVVGPLFHFFDFNFLQSFKLEIFILFTLFQIHQDGDNVRIYFFQIF